LLSTIPTVLKVPSLASNADPIFGKGVGPRGTCLWTTPNEWTCKLTSTFGAAYSGVIICFDSGARLSNPPGLFTVIGSSCFWSEI